MPKKRYSIEDYIKRQLNSIPINSDIGGLHSSEAKTAFSKAISSALAKKARSAAGYGKNAERLSGLGLVDSGYADYIEKRASTRLKTDIADATDDMILGTERAVQAAKYKDTTLLSLEDKLSSYAIKNDISDEDALRLYGKTLGIEPERLAEAARNAISANERYKRDKGFNEVHKNIVYRRLTRNEAYQYALSLGLSEDDATKLGEIAYKINESLDGSNY